jgi:hypothetical protein
MGDDSGRSPDPGPSVAHLDPPLADKQDRVLEDGSVAPRSWVARHYAALPNPRHVVTGVDPLRVPGRRRGQGAPASGAIR